MCYVKICLLNPEPGGVASFTQHAKDTQASVHETQKLFTEQTNCSFR